ncbi:MAG TPA: hypothetical protein VII75_13905 [Thermoanaerobaculia bacterium]|nr:hypothetical protein [Thermoanaerobaculia bacterium]
MAKVLTLPFALWLATLAGTYVVVFVLRRHLHPFWIRWELLASMASAFFYLLCMPLADARNRGGRNLQDLISTGSTRVAIDALRHTLPGGLLALVSVAILIEAFSPGTLGSSAWVVSARLDLVLLAFVSFLFGDALLLRKLESSRGASGWRRDIETDLWFVDLPFAVAYAVLFVAYQREVSSTSFLQRSLLPFVAGAGALEILVRGMVHAFTLSGLSEENEGGESERSRSSGLAITAVAILFAVAVIAGLFTPMSGEFSPPESLNVNIDFPRGQRLADLPRPVFALSPSGNAIVFVGEDASGVHHLYYRHLGERESRLIKGTEGAEQPFFSSDETQIGFVADTGLKVVRVDLHADTPRILCHAPKVRGASWGNHEIVFTPDIGTGLWRVALPNGPCAPLTRLAEGENTHRWPVVLPGGRTVLYACEKQGEWSIRSLDRATGKQRTITSNALFPRYSSEHLVFARDNDLFALLIAEDGIPQGEEYKIASDAVTFPAETGAGQFDASQSGSLAYVAAGDNCSEPQDIVWLDLKGEIKESMRSVPCLQKPVLSPSGQWLALRRGGTSTDDITVIDGRSHAEVRRITPRAACSDPVWASDGQLFLSARCDGAWRLYSDSSDKPLRVMSPQPDMYPTSYSKPAHRLAFAQQNVGTRWDIGLIELDAAGNVKSQRLVLSSAASETFGALSPSGRYLAYVSDETGRMQVHLMDLETKAKWPVSVDGGAEPVWSKDGTHLYFRTDTYLMRVAISALDGPQLPVEKLFEDHYDRGPLGFANYDVTASNEFIMLGNSYAELELVLVTNWTEASR